MLREVLQVMGHIRGWIMRFSQPMSKNVQKDIKELQKY
jgi:hypothetical protein